MDIAAIVILSVLASLSKRIGEALNVASYYYLFHVSIILTIIAIILNTEFYNTYVTISPEVSDLISIIIRLLAGLISVFACMQYWKWLFSENFKR